MLRILSGNIIGNVGKNFYSNMKPWRHPCGVYWWICDNPDGSYELNNLINVKQRTQTEIEATPEYVAWAAQQQLEEDAQQAPALFQTLPAWVKTYTSGDIANYIDTNVTDLASAKVALTHLGEAFVALRDFAKIRLM
jgi:hypothetical protein